MVAVTIPANKTSIARDGRWSSLHARVAAPLAILDQGLVSGVNFLTAQLLIAYGSKEAGGAYALVWVLVLFTRSTVINLVAAPYAVRHSRRDGSFALYAANSFVQQLAISSIAALVFAILGATYFYLTPSTPFASSLGYSFSAAAAILPIMMAREYARQVSFAHATPVAALVMDGVAGSVQLAILYATLSWQGGAPLAYLASGVGAALGLAAWAAFRLQSVQFAAGRAKADWAENWRFGRWALLSQVTGNLAPLPWILFAIWGAGETGAFDGANRIVGLSNILVIGYCNFFAAAAAAAYAMHGAKGLNQIVFRAVMLFSAGLGGVCVLAFFWGGDLLQLVMHGKVENSGGMVAVLACATLLDGLSQLCLHGLRAMNRPADAVVPDLCEVFVTLAFAIPLVWFWSAPGAAWAMVIGRFAGLLLRWSVYVRRSQADLMSNPAPSGTS